MMKGKGKTVLSALILVLVMAGCNSDLEKRVSSLERRVVEIENRTQLQKPVNQGLQTNDQTITQTPAEPETKPDGPLPAFQFAESAHDFGQITEGDVVTHTFKFTNTGDAPLIIQNATASCGCTIPSYPKEPVPAGENGEIVVKFNSAHKAGIQNKTVTITANTFPAQSKINIKSLVVAKENDAEGPTK